MPGIAIEHIARIELSEGLFGGKKQLLDFQNPALPSLDFKVPADFLLSPGTKVPLDKNLVAEIGELAAGSSSGLPLSLPISVSNDDYNPHPCESFKLYAQSKNGEVWEYSAIGESRGWNSDELPGKTTRKLNAARTDSGSRGSLSEGLHAVLLYRSPEGILSEQRFCGFVPIPPDDVRQRMRRTMGGPAASDRSAAKAAPTEPQPPMAPMAPVGQDKSSDEDSPTPSGTKVGFGEEIRIRGGYEQCTVVFKKVYRTGWERKMLDIELVPTDKLVVEYTYKNTTQKEEFAFRIKTSTDPMAGIGSTVEIETADGGLPIYGGDESEIETCRPGQTITRKVTFLVPKKATPKFLVITNNVRVRIPSDIKSGGM
jgi:hypothetical protein